MHISVCHNSVCYSLLMYHVEESQSHMGCENSHKALACTIAVLVMDDTGSVGLDLSFAGAVFLMEPLADAALEQQVVSRAHRMGADPKRPILVETLVMKVRHDCNSGQTVGVSRRASAPWL